MKTKLTTLALCAIAMSNAFGTVSLNFNLPFESGIASNLANASGTVINGLKWGILVDGSGNGILKSDSSKYDAIAGGLVSGSTYVLSANSVATDDILYMASSLTSNTNLGDPEVDGVTLGGNGGIFDINDLTLANGAGTNDKFYVVWFDGSKGGTLTDATYTLPAEGSLCGYGVPFEGTDPIRNANNSYVGTAPTAVVGGGIAFIPEPSAAMLGAIGVLGLLRRRRI